MLPPTQYAAARLHIVLSGPLLLRPRSIAKTTPMLPQKVKAVVPRFLVVRHNLLKLISATRPSLILMCSSGRCQAEAVTNPIELALTMCQRPPECQGLE